MAMNRKSAVLLLAAVINIFLIGAAVVAAASDGESTEGYYEWIFSKENFLTDEENQSFFRDTAGKNSAVMNGRTKPVFLNGRTRLYGNTFFDLTVPVTLEDDKCWRVEWKGQMESGTVYNCETILGNNNAEQYIMYGSDSIFFGVNSDNRAELPCARDTVAYKNTSYVLECDGNRHIRLTYQTDGAERVIGKWTDYPQEVGDLSFNALFGSYQNILYKGYIEYLRVWEDFPEDFEEDPLTVFEADTKITDTDGNEVYGSESDIGKTGFRLEGRIISSARKNPSTLSVFMAAYNEDGSLNKVSMKDIYVPAQSVVELAGENEIGLEGAAMEKGMTLKCFIFNEKMMPAAPATEIVFDGKFRGSVRMLSIGNSYSLDASTMVHDIAAADGVDINITNLHIGGCTLEMHWANVLSNASYARQLNGNSFGESTIKTELENGEWDYVSLQQGSHESNDFSKYWTDERPYLTNLSDYVRELAPGAELLIHQTWAYENKYAVSRLGYTGEAPEARNKMFEDVKEAYRLAAEKIGANILPSGEAVQYVQNVMGFSESQIYRDQYSHLTEDKGRYLVAAVWYEKLTGNSILTNTFRPAGISDRDLEKLKTAAHYAANLPEYEWK